MIPPSELEKLLELAKGATPDELFSDGSQAYLRAISPEVTIALVKELLRAREALKRVHIFATENHDFADEARDHPMASAMKWLSALAQDAMGASNIVVSPCKALEAYDNARDTK